MDDTEAELLKHLGVLFGLQCVVEAVLDVFPRFSDPALGMYVGYRLWVVKHAALHLLLNRKGHLILIWIIYLKTLGLWKTDSLLKIWKNEVDAV